MSRTILKADNKTEKLILQYVELHASEALVEKINAGNKTLAGCFKYICGEAKKQAVKGCACIPDDVVFGWAMHFFEEDAIEVSASGDAADVKVETSTPQPKSKQPKKKEAAQDQISLFDDLFAEGL